MIYEHICIDQREVIHIQTWYHTLTTEAYDCIGPERYFICYHESCAEFYEHGSILITAITSV